MERKGAYVGVLNNKKRKSEESVQNVTWIKKKNQIIPMKMTSDGKSTRKENFGKVLYNN